MVSFRLEAVRFKKGGSDVMRITYGNNFICSEKNMMVEFFRKV